MTMRSSVTAVLLVAFGLLAGCDLFSSEAPKTARLRLEGNAGSTLQLIATQQFASQRQPLYEPISGAQIGDTLLIVILEADTVEVNLPYDEEFDIRDTQRFYARILRQEPNADQLQGRLWIDGKLRADQRPAAGQDSIFFLYTFVDGRRDPIIEF